jgi:hypothetical protein
MTKPLLNKDKPGKVNPSLIKYEDIKDEDGNVVSGIIWVYKSGKSQYFGCITSIKRDHNVGDPEYFCPKGLYLEMGEIRMGMPMISIRFRIGDDPEFKPTGKIIIPNENTVDLLFPIDEEDEENEVEFMQELKNMLDLSQLPIVDGDDAFEDEK